MDIIQDVLVYQTQMMRNSSLGPYVPPDFSPPEHIVIVNCLFYASLGVMILAAFIAMLIKSWVREFDRGLRAISIPEQRAKTREFRYLGMERWKLPEMVGILPFLIQISLLLFSIGLVLFLFHISKPSFGITTAIFGVGVLYYAVTTSISVFVTSSPFHSPLSRTLGKVYQHVHAYFCPSIRDFLSNTMDATPATALGRVHRNIQIDLQKSRPYLEKDFVEPVTANTMDEVQLSIAASALKRIHDSAPNSHHSVGLQSSVWWVTGSPAYRCPPLFNLPPWILDIDDDNEYFSFIHPAILATLIATSLRARRKMDVKRITKARDILQRPDMDISKDPWVGVVIAVVDLLLGQNSWIPYHVEEMRQTESNDLTSIVRRKELHWEGSLWLLSTLSELRGEGWLSQEEPPFIGVCLPMLMNGAISWDHRNQPDIALLEAVVTLAAISCSPDRANRLKILSSSRDHPWLLRNIRNTDLIGTLYEGTPSDNHQQLTSLLFLIVHALICHKSYELAVQYFNIITAKGDLLLCASALTVIAPVMANFGLSAIGMMLVAPHAQDRILMLHYFPFHAEGSALGNILDNYDQHLGAIVNPDPNIIAILLMLSIHLALPETQWRLSLNPELKNPWLRLVATAVARSDLPDGSGIPMCLSYDHRVHNMIAALSLLRYTRGNVTHYTESLLLASFLQSSELPTSFVALEYYLETIISYSNPPAPSSYLAAAVSSAFNVVLPEEQLWRRWAILDIFVDGFETLSVEWQRTFAEGFFTLSRRPLPRIRGDMDSSTPESELEAILTWEYFHEQEKEPELTDSHFSGLDWMSMAWSLHLSQPSRRKTAGLRQGKAQLRTLSGPAVDEIFLCTALCKLLDAAPYYRIVPIIPTLREFIQWFDDAELSEYRSMISTRVNEAVRNHEEFQMLHRFRKFNCIWYF